MKLSLPSISVQAPMEEIAQKIQDASDGILLVTDLPRAPFATIRTVIDGAKPLEDRLNKAYPKNLVFKDAAGKTKNPHVDHKRVLDLSPTRLQAIQDADPHLWDQHTSGPWMEAMDFWENVEKVTTDSILPALSLAVGGDQVMQDAAFNYRMVDYYPILDQTTPPRCQEHRDFGSFTLIFASHPGLQVKIQDSWCDVGDIPEGSAVLLFGWCTQIRSNDRIPAVLHQVRRDHRARTSAVLFCAPKHTETPLEPVVGPNEVARYVSGVRVGQLRGKMARKWRHREGTLSNDDQILEETEIRVTAMKTQDDVVGRTLKCGAPN